MLCKLWRAFLALTVIGWLKFVLAVAIPGWITIVVLNAALGDGKWGNTAHFGTIGDALAPVGSVLTVMALLIAFGQRHDDAEAHERHEYPAEGIDEAGRLRFRSHGRPPMVCSYHPCAA